MAEESPTPTGETLFPAREVRLSNGRTVRVKPWGMATGRLLQPRVLKLMTQLRGVSAVDVAELIGRFQDEVYDIVAHTIGFSNDEMNELLFEDLLTLAQAVIATSLIRRGPDGKLEGSLGKLLALAGSSPEEMLARVLRLARQTQTSATERSPRASSTSSRKDTPSGTSSSTPSTS